MIRSFCGLKQGRSRFGDFLVYDEEVEDRPDFWIRVLYLKWVRRGEGNVA